MTIVCLGDSLTYGYEVERPAVWTALAAETTGERIVNKGVNGLMTAGMLASFAQAVVRENADAVLLMGGANDILSGLSPDEPEKNMATMIKRAEDAGIRPLVGVPVPFCPPIRDDWAAMADFPARTPVYEEYVRTLRKLAERTACAVVDFRSGMEQHIRETGCGARSLYIDGIHLNRDGHRLFAETFVSTLRVLGVIPA